MTIAIVAALVILLFRFDSTHVMNPIDSNAEWLEADGLGGFASGTVSGIRTRRYHALLLTATTPPAGRMVLVNGFDAWVETPRWNLCPFLATLRPRRDSSRWRDAHRNFRTRAVAAVALQDRRYS